MLCDPGRVAEVHSILEEELWRHARIQIPPGQHEDLEQGWICSSWLGNLEDSARMWRNGDIPSTKQGLKILVCPVGHPDFVQDQFSKLSDRHDVLLGIAMVEDLQSARFLLVCCAAARANFFLRSVMIRSGHVVHAARH